MVKANDLLDAPGVTNTAGLAQATSGKGVAAGAALSLPPPQAASKDSIKADAALLSQREVFM
ncbi:MAG: hypothetical protein HC858_05315 [Brachymonas sp.]|nr:hypothetical protein [Brachymonas sp.]